MGRNDATQWNFYHNKRTNDVYSLLYAVRQCVTNSHRRGHHNRQSLPVYIQTFCLVHRIRIRICKCIYATNDDLVNSAYHRLLTITKTFVYKSITIRHNCFSYSALISVLPDCRQILSYSSTFACQGKMSAQNETCPICYETSKSLASLHLHGIRRHPGQLDCCPICYQPTTSDDLAKHSNLRHQRRMKRNNGVCDCAMCIVYTIFESTWFLQGFCVCFPDNKGRF